MKILLKSAYIEDEQSSFHQKRVSILIEDGIISDINDHISPPEDVTVLDLENLHVSQGWFDSSVSFGEPGYEERETLENGLRTAALSGFTAIAANPDTNPYMDNAASLTYLLSKTKHYPTKLYAVANLTNKGAGIDLAEIYDMHSNGATAYYDYKKPISNPNLLKIALQYAQNFDGLVQSFPLDKSIAGNGVMNENKNSTQLGLKGIPALAEELQIARDLQILEYTGGKLHIPTISTKKSLALIKKAKEQKLDVSCSVSVFHLCFDDSCLTEFDTNFKISPPLRTKEDCEALVNGVIDGTIDMITSDHRPMDIENKQIEFDHAANGSIGLEALFGMLCNLIPLSVLIKKLTVSKKRFNIPISPIEVGNIAELTLFNPDKKYIFTKKEIYSSNSNCMFLGCPIYGKTYGIINQNNLLLK